MSFIVKANSLRPGEGSFHAETLTRESAVETALGLVGEGMDGVTITDETGRVGPDPTLKFHQIWLSQPRSFGFLAISLIF